MKQVPKSEFKPKAFEYFRMVEDNGEAIMVTDHGHPAVIISPAEQRDASAKGALAGAIGRYSEPVRPIDDAEWDALQ